MANNPFNLNYQFKLYLERVGLKEETMNPIQLQETKRAFYGSAGQMLILLRDDVGALPEEEAIKTMQYMLDQVGNFWNHQINKQK